MSDVKADLLLCKEQKSRGKTAAWPAGCWVSPGQEKWGLQDKGHPNVPTDDGAGLLEPPQSWDTGCPKVQRVGSWRLGRSAQTGHRNQRRHVIDSGIYRGGLTKGTRGRAQTAGH